VENEKKKKKITLSTSFLDHILMVSKCLILRHLPRSSFYYRKSIFVRLFDGAVSAIERELFDFF